MLTTGHSAFLHLRPPQPRCEISVVVPVRNEQQRLEQCLHALYRQKTLCGNEFDHERYEVLLLLNNCTDASPRVARRFAARHMDFQLHVVEHTFEKQHAHVGSARSMLMQHAARRLRSASCASSRPAPRLLLLTTDADTVVDPSWLAETVGAFEKGADAVGGDILIPASERQGLARQARHAYASDRRYLRAVCLLESLLDPLAHDPWPRHHHNFGASLACTLHAFDVCGGMAPSPFLEDLAFYRALLDAGMRFRHEPRVRVYTSARTHGRASIGLSEQLRQWHGDAAVPVPSAKFHERRCVVLSELRSAMRGHRKWLHASQLLSMGSQYLSDLSLTLGSAEALWSVIDGDAVIRSRLPLAEREGSMRAELAKLQTLIQQLQPIVATHSVDRTPDVATQGRATTAAPATHCVLHPPLAGSPPQEVSNAPAAGPHLLAGVGL